MAAADVCWLLSRVQDEFLKLWCAEEQRQFRSEQSETVILNTDVHTTL